MEMEVLFYFAFNNTGDYSVLGWSSTETIMMMQKAGEPVTKQSLQ